MSKTTSQKEVIIAIVLAGVLIAGSLVFFALQMRPAPVPQVAIDEAQLAEKIKGEILAGLPTPQVAIDEAQLAATIKEQIVAELQDGELQEELKQAILADLQEGELLDPQIDAGIQRFLQKQQEAQRKAQEERQRQAEEKAKNVRKVSPERDHIYGATDAVISLIEYSDFECPFCKRFHPTPKKVVEAYDGKVNWVYRHYPLSFHNPGAQKQAEASECAAELGGNDAFWTYSDLIYERTTSNGKGFPIEKLVPLAEEIGLDSEQFQACLDSGKYEKRVQEEFQEGSNSGISGTPGSILLNNETGEARLLSGAVPFENFQQVIDEMLQ